MKKTFFFILLSTIALPFWAQEHNYHLLIGTYTNTGTSEGIYTYDVDLGKGLFTQKSVTKGIQNPSYIALSQDKKFVYSANETGNTSTVSAFSFDSVSGKLIHLNTVDAQGADPCYLSVSNNHVVTANYSGGSLCVFGRKPDGVLTEALQIIQHTGSSIDHKRQTAPHMHQVVFSPDVKYLLANDLGTDKVTVYQYNPKRKNSILNPFDSIPVKPGSGPRHVTFSKDGKRIYLLHEMDGTVSVLEMKKGKLKRLQETTVVRKSSIENGAADIHLSPDGQFLYATNRGTANDISCFSVNSDGTITYKSQVSTGGLSPRNFSITPDGKYVFVANQRSDNVVIFKRDKKSGLMNDTGKRIEVGAPVCLLLY